jgi:hypothetical protein
MGPSEADLGMPSVRGGDGAANDNGNNNNNNNNASGGGGRGESEVGRPPILDPRSKIKKLCLLCLCETVPV